MRFQTLEAFGRRHVPAPTGWIALITILAITVPASGQAWTPPAGSGSLWLTAQRLHADAHTEGDGDYQHNIDLLAHSMTAALDYGVTDRLALSIALPYVTSRYEGPIPHAGSLVDDGQYHGSISDLDLELRYKAVDGLFVITPFVGGQWPTRDYPTLGHATAGRGLTEYALGFDVGHEAAWLAPALYLAGGYSYSIVEKVHEDINVNRSNLDLRAAYYVTSRLSVQVASMWQKTHGGIDIPFSPEDRVRHAHHHDQMLRADHWRTSAAVGYAIRPNVDVVLGWATSIRSENSHAFRTLSLGAGWTFDGPKIP